MEDEETMEHVLCTCSAVTRTRHSILGKLTLTLQPKEKIIKLITKLVLEGKLRIDWNEPQWTFGGPKRPDTDPPTM